MPLEFLKFRPSDRMKIEIIQNTVVNQKTAVVGEIIDCPAGDGAFLVGIGRARKYVEPPPAETVKPPAVAGKTPKVEKGKPNV